MDCLCEKIKLGENRLENRSSNITFGTKAETLRTLKPLINKGTILDSIIFTQDQWNKDNNSIITSVQEKFATSDFVIVRSSSYEEDSSAQSLAGHFTSVGKVPTTNSNSLKSAIKKVISSIESSEKSNQIFIQPHLNNICISGVLFTRDLDSLAPYYIVNYDESKNSFDTVTSGNSNDLKTYIRFKNSPFKVHGNLKKLFSAAKELEGLLGNDALDIEFAIDSNQDLYIFQVRPIVIGNKLNNVPDLYKLLSKVTKKFKKLNSPHPNLYGERTLFGVMPDWNPAEMIGIKPRKLALSLYKELITDSIWAYQRDNYGYKNLRSFPLLISFLGLPYIDVRVSFNSFIPSEIENDLSVKLTNYYINELLKDHTNHDKIEFNIIYSCYYLSLDEKIEKLSKSGFSNNEILKIKAGLLNLTNNIISPLNGLYIQDIEKINTLEKKYTPIVSSEMSDLDKIYWLVEECKRLGTLPFAGLARAGFIAIQFLKSFVDVGIFTSEDYNNFMSSLDTVAKQMNRDYSLYSSGKLSKQDFITHYGHLRPGTYDILSKRYDEDLELYFSKNTTNNLTEVTDSQFIFNKDHLNKIDDRLKKIGIKVTSSELIVFIKKAIEGREYSKFMFTKFVSKILFLIQKLGKKYGFSREQMSHIDITTLLKLYSSLDTQNLDGIIQNDIIQNQMAYEVTKFINLPQLITSEEEIYDFFLTDNEPNFITNNSVTAEIVSENEIYEKVLTGKIVFIKSADPGFDWMFSKNISGLITMYGGANSHMAIRCSELSIPAIIGCGEKKYTQWNKTTRIRIDCTNKKVEVLK